MLIVVLHVLAVYGLARALAPDLTASVERSVLSTFTVMEPPPPAPKPPPQAESKPDEGAQGNPGRKAVARNVAVPEPEIPLAKPSPAPRATSTGTANSAGAAQNGTGTGAAGQGSGTGSGRGGSGAGGIAASKPVKIAGDINSARDFPTPAGGRQIRWGQSVTVYMTVGTDGRARNCRVAKPSIDPVADQIVCQLAEQRFRFRPARDSQGNPVEASYGWQQRWKPAG